MQLTAEKRYASFASQCRQLLAQNIPPDSVQWRDPYSSGVPDDLFALTPATEAPQQSRPAESKTTVPAPRVPREFIGIAQDVFHHAAPLRHHLLYTALYRITRGEHHLLQLVTDDLVHQLLLLQKQVKRDIHKMHAFVRFRKVPGDSGDWYVAWHRPDYHVLRPATPFFRDRFRTMNWTILTPDESASWNGDQLTFGTGSPADPISGDALEELWQTYYASTFNPARANLAVTKTHMPARYWKTMPETRLIPELLHASTERTSAMLTSAGATALDFLPKDPSIEHLRTAAESCRGCPLYHNTNHAVCSEGPASARLVLVGEQPGDHEDLQGRPFVGPSGAILNRALAAAAIPREAVYITESVKHFKHEIAGKKRIHRSPNSVDIAACRPWLVAEMQAVKPKVILCLGASAAQSVLGRKVTLKEVRGNIIESPLCPQTLVTTHPAAILRQANDRAASEAFDQLAADLKTAWILAHRDIA